jgi:hypothetical protein
LHDPRPISFSEEIVRVRITQNLSGSIDGIQLRDFVSGEVYDVSTSLGSYLLCERWAEAVAEEGPALVIPLGETRSMWSARDRADVRARAADRSRRALHLVDPDTAG